MLENDLTILISSCDNFNDLWKENLCAYKKYWKNNPCKTILVTDKNRTFLEKDVGFIVDEGEKSFPLRIRYALEQVTTPYVLVTLDDYFLIKPVINQDVSYLIERMKKERIDYLSLYNRRYTKKKQFLPIEELLPIKLNENYAVTLYPAIWKVDFMKKTIKDDLTPWLYEVTLTEMAKEQHAKCMESRSGVYVILDVVRKGKVLHQAQHYFKKHGINIGDRPSAKYIDELSLAIRDTINWYTPKAFSEFIKKIGRKCGMTFFSDNLKNNT